MKARAVSSCILFVLFALVAFGLATVAESKTYYGVTFPHGDAAFADRVVDYLAASCVRAAYDDPEEALGPPDSCGNGCDACNGCDTNAVNLGMRLSVLDNRGYLVLEFVDNALVDVTGDDLFVYNTNSHPARVEISKDGITFIDVGEIVGYPGAIDIAPYVNAGDEYRFVRLSDVPADEDHSNCPGPSIDAVGAMGIEEIVYTGEAFGSLELLPVGDLAFAFEQSANTLLIILDVSGSMSETINGEVKIDIAKSVLLDLLDSMPDNVQVGVRIFGLNCRTELLSAVGPVQRAQLRQDILEIEPRGATPIALALQETANDLQQISDPQLLLLISDGMETCGGDPVQAARDLLGLGYDLKFHIVGFDIARNVPARDQLIEIANATSGRYFDADNSDELRSALSLVAPFAYTVYDSDGNEVYSGRLGETGPQLPTGTYTIVIESTPPITLNNVTVQEQETTLVRVEQADGAYQAEVEN